MLSNSHGILDLKLSSTLNTNYFAVRDCGGPTSCWARIFHEKKNHEILIFSNLASFFTYLFYFCKNDSETRRSFNGKIKRKNLKEASLPITQVWNEEKIAKRNLIKNWKKWIAEGILKHFYVWPPIYGLYITFIIMNFLRVERNEILYEIELTFFND